MSNPLHIIKTFCVVLAMIIYLFNSWLAALFYIEGSFRNWDIKFACWCFIFALIAQSASLSGSKLVRFFSGIAIAWFLSDAVNFIFTHEMTDVTERNKCDYLVIIITFIFGCVHYHANTKLYKVILKWQKNK